MGNAQYKLYYFGFKFRAEVIRLIFEAAGKPYEDIRFEQSKWPEYKSMAPFGTAPFLQVTSGSQTLCLGESVAIARYLARKFKLAGKSDEEAAIVDMYGDHITDLMNAMVRLFSEKDEQKKKQDQEKFDNETLPKHLKNLEERIIQSRSGFVAPSGLTWVDLYLFNFLDLQGDKAQTLFNNFPNIKKLDEKVRSNPKIAQYLKRRPVTPF
uniref:Glutathione S-transferase S4 n=1 Tax=Brachionus rotundiformis TaxID=96890 RepID=A0A3G2JSE3_9BILA|nr:glutathione S-transferase S4 [Brachionus rotundiformis]